MFQIAVGSAHMCILHLFYSGCKCLILAVCKCDNKCILSFIANLEYCTFFSALREKKDFHSTHMLDFFHLEL